MISEEASSHLEENQTYIELTEEIPSELTNESEQFPYKKCVINECFQFKQTNKLNKPLSTFFSPNQPIGFKSFDFITLLGKGSFGKVFLVRYKETGQYFACKVLNKNSLQRRHLTKYALSEVRIMHLYGDHPFILKLHYAF